MSVPRLYFQHGGIAEQVLERCSAIKQPFNPTMWAPNPHMQSALGLARTLTVKGSYTRQLVMTSDHGTLGLDWWCGADGRSYAAADVPIILFIHGINGGSHEGYVKWACVAAASRGWRAVVLNMRGCNGLPLTSARGYNAIMTGDVHVAVSSIRSRFPDAPLMAAGYSLGSVLLAKYLAEADNGLYSTPDSPKQQQRQQQTRFNPKQRQQPANATAASSVMGGLGMSACSGGESLPDMQGSGLVAAALVSPPVCLHTTNSNLGRPSRPFKFMYNLAVAYKLREYVKEHLPSIQSSGMNVDTEAMLQGWTVSSFDDAVTLRALGYPAPHHYYRHACSTNWIPHIRTPTLIMLSRDDPFLGVLPQEQVRANPFTALAATRKGGHLAFLQGWWPLGQSYCDAVIDDWFAAALAEWRHGLDGILATADDLSSSSSRGRPSSSRTCKASRISSSSSSVSMMPELSSHMLPSWRERARRLGWQPQHEVDPTTLGAVLCKCNPGLDPFAQAHATDAVLNVAAAPATAAIKVAAAGASKAAAAAGKAQHSWLFGFGGRASSRASESRPDGAWAPFEGLDSDVPESLFSSLSGLTNSNGDVTVEASESILVGHGGLNASLTAAAAAAAADDVASNGYLERDDIPTRHWRRRMRSKL